MKEGALSVGARTVQISSVAKPFCPDVSLVEALRLDDGQLASRSGHLGAALHHLDAASAAP